jgi:O-acetyl-ADP-ribose deacetylase (regulator of RNase III)
MAAKLDGKKCFVIMPFGQKKNLVDDKVEELVDFDMIYKSFIKDAVKSLGMKCVRCDEVKQTGSIHDIMFEHIYEADVAIVDITALNANVFYELGIRHALNKRVTILMCQPGTKTPFNIQGYQMLTYNPKDSNSLKNAKSTIAEYIKNGLANEKTDSPVYDALDNLNVERKPKPIDQKDIYLYKVKSRTGKEIGVITGDIKNIKEADVWVNSENTNMQMARHFDRSISATIRYMGAEKDEFGRVVKDLVADELHEAALAGNVPPGAVKDTTSGALRDSNSVKRVFHAAAVVGLPGKGYQLIDDATVCIDNALKLADSPRLQKEEEIRSILFPLMGTATARANAQKVADELIEAAVCYYLDNPKSKINRIYFLAYSEQDLQICLNKFDKDTRLQAVKTKSAKPKTVKPKPGSEKPKLTVKLTKKKI